MSEAEVAMDDYDDDVQHPASPMALAELARMAEAIIFASSEPVSERALAERLPVNTDLSDRKSVV